MHVIDNQIYDRVHTTWWGDDGFMALLRTSINPPRFKYFKNALVERIGLDPRSLRVLDIGCGGGLLSEQFAAIGCTVTGIDRSVPTLATAKTHAEKSGLSIQYIEGSAEQLPLDAAQFDVVCCCDVLEYVDNIDAVISELSRVLKPGGIFFFDTINRTLMSQLVAIKIAQDWPISRFVPRNVHVWHQFIRPNELAFALTKNGFPHCEFAGLSPATNPINALIALTRKKLGQISFAELGEKLMLKESKNLSISYMGFAIRTMHTTK